MVLHSRSSVFRRLWEKIKLLWKLAKSERATPREIGWAVFIGGFAACTPFIGFHGWLGLGLATLFKKNRLFAWLGTRIANMVFLPFIALAEVQISHRLRVGEFVSITRDNALEQAPNLLLDWCLGCIPVGAAAGLVLGMSAYGIAHRRDKRKRLNDLRERVPGESQGIAEEKAADEATRAPEQTPAELPPPSSGSPA